MGIVERRQRQKEEVRKDIITTAWDMVKRDGWQALSIRKIAEAIEYSVPVIYDHFESKDAILIEFGKMGFSKLTARLKEARDEHKDPAEQIRAMANAYWTFATSYIELYQLMFGIGMARCDSDKCTEEVDKLYDVMIEPIEALLKKHGRSDVNVCFKYHTLWSFMHGLISIKLNGNSPVDPELDKMVWDDAITAYIRNLG